MPDEEMEITTDLAQPGFAEDIDIDLDFPQPDEDMELADFDQTQDMQSFNFDARDELMAEGDDESFGMVDAEDIIHNEAATAANDIEIDIGGPDDGLLPEVTAYNSAPHQVDEIDYVDAIGTEDQNIESGDWFQASADPVSGSAEGQVSLEEPAATAAADAPSVSDTTALPSAEINIQGTTVTSDVDQTDDTSYGAQLQDLADQENVGHGDAGTSYEVEQNDVLETSKDLSNEKHDDVTGLEEHFGGETAEAGEAEDLASAKELGDAEEIGEVEETREADDPDLAEQVQEVVEGAETDLPADDDFEEQRSANDGHSVADQETAESHPNGELYEEHVDDENLTNEGNKEDEALPNGPALQDEADGHEYYTDTYQDGPDHKELNGAQDASTEAIVSIAARHGLYITYGETDYRLFAKSEEDDPNQYFLKDTSALELSLAGFLISLRDVVSEEVSPLDELVMHVDGLGIEFAESTASDFLEKFTFGDILKLYDDLVKNDEAETPPDLYCHLMVRPNCNQRLMALLDSASSGRGLSEIAVYRETTPFDEAHGSEPSSSAQSVSPDDEAADKADEYNEEAPEENVLNEEDAHDDHGADETAGFEDDSESKSIGAAEAVNLEVTKSTGDIAKTPVKGAKDTTNAEPEDDLINFSDEELDLSPSKEDQPVQPRLEDKGSPEDPTSQEVDVKVTGGHSPSAKSPNERTEAPISDNTSATATLNGDDRDEIDYSDDEDVGNKDQVTVDAEKAHVSASPKASNDEEITWESDTEETKTPVKGSSNSNGTIQVSSPHNKRSRSESDDVDGEGEQIGMSSGSNGD